MKRILTVVGDEYSLHLEGLLAPPVVWGPYSFVVHHSPAAFAGLDIDRYAAVCLYVNIKTIPDDLYRRLTGFIRRGGGMIAFHSTSNSFRNQPSFETVLGARFLRHGKTARYRIEPAGADDPLAEGVPAFEVEDELFRQRYASAVKARFIHRSARIAEPVVWSKRYGKGTVIGISPGHRVETMKDENLRRIFANGLRMIVPWDAV